MNRYPKTVSWAMLGIGILVLIFAWPALSFAARDNPDMRVIAMGPSGLTLELTVPAYQVEEVEGPDGFYHRLRIPGWASTDRPGYPELPVRGILIEVPESGDVRVDVEDVVYGPIEGMRIYPTPGLEILDDGTAVERFEKDEKTYGARGPYPRDLVSVSSKGMVRGTPVVRILVYPFQWEPQTERLLMCERLWLRVTFEGRLSTSFDHSESDEDALWRHMKAGRIPNFSGGGPAASPEPMEGPKLTRVPDVIRIETTQKGICRMTYAALAAAGLPEDIDCGTLQVFNQGAEIAIRVQCSGAVFSSGDYIDFYAQPWNNQFTETNVYWLHWGLSAGKRMQTTDGTSTGGVTVNSFYETLHVEENGALWDATPGAPDVDYWFWEKLTAPVTKDYSVNVPSPVSGAASATVRVCFQGRSTSSPHPNHRTRIRWNGTEIGSALWDGAVPYTQEMGVSSSLLTEGANTCRVELPGDTGATVDIVYLNWIEIGYWRQLRAASNRLQFRITASDAREVEVKGFGSSDLCLYDVTDPLNPKRVTGFSVSADAGQYKAVFRDRTGGQREFWIGTNSGVLAPSDVELWHSRYYGSSENRADWIVVTKRAFLPAFYPLVKLRKSQGLITKVVAVEDIYNEFSHGLFDPAAIKAFLQTAYDNWARPAPAYVLLAGDANMDYRDHLATGKENVIPPHLIYSSFLIPSDNWYACMDGPEDILPDLFMGRIPGSSVDGIADQVDKIVHYEQSAWTGQQKVLLVADNNESSFETANEALIPYLPAQMGVEKVYLREYAAVADATQDLIDFLDVGVILTNYVGHGAVTNWSGEYLFETSDIPLLSNGNRLAFVVAMTCLNGYFCQPFYYCLGEAFLADGNRGAIGAFAPSGLGYVWAHQILDTQLVTQLFQENVTIAGPAVTGAKMAAYAQGIPGDMIEMFTLFGDPATRLRIPQQAGSMDWGKWPDGSGPWGRPMRTVEAVEGTLSNVQHRTSSAQR